MAAAALVGPAQLAVPPPAGAATATSCAFADSSLDESSGVASASWSDDVVWTHEDSGAAPEVLLVDGRTCETTARRRLAGATATDWEDLGRWRLPDGTSVLRVADVGDNGRRRSSVEVLEVVEPPEGGGRVPLAVARRWRLSMPGGPADAEALLADPETGRPVLVTKDRTDGRSLVVRAPAEGGGTGELLATLDVRSLPGAGSIPLGWAVTGGSTRLDGREVVLRTYLAAWRWPVAEGEPMAAALARRPERVDLPFGGQAEAVAHTRDGEGVWTTSEGVGAVLRRTPLAGAPAGAGGGTTSGAQSPVVDPAEPPVDRSRRSRPWWSIAVPAAVAALLVAVFLARRRRA